jgi:hypothetical protein
MAIPFTAFTQSVKYFFYAELQLSNGGRAKLDGIYLAPKRIDSSDDLMRLRQWILEASQFSKAKASDVVIVNLSLV